MAQVKNLNVAPYYDDFDVKDNFHKVLFRPGFAIQARELTSLQSILQNQIERHGAHMFKEGTVVIPGQVSYSDSYLSVRLSDTFANEQIRLNQYLNFDNPVIVTGETSGVKAKITNYTPARSGKSPYLYGDIVSAGSDGKRIKFINGENLVANIATQHTTSYSAETASLKTFIEPNPNISCSQIGSAVTVEEGVYFIRGQFVRCQRQIMVLSPNSNKFSARIGFVILERLEVPEFDTTLTDNSTGSTNYAAKGAHRLKLKLRLKKIPISSPTPDSFVELLQIKQGRIVKLAKNTEYSVIGDELARRTYDESGDYTTKPFTFKIQEQIDNDYKGITYKGAYGVTTGSRVITDDNIVANTNLLNLQVSTGKAYVKGYEVEKIGATNITLGKARAFNTVNAGVSTFSVGNFVNITNVFGMPDITNISGETDPYREIGIYTGSTLVVDSGGAISFSGATTRSSGHFHTSRGVQIGTARARAIEFKSGTQGNASSIYKLFLFDIRMFTELRLTDSSLFNFAITPSLFSNHADGGVKITGASSGATGFVYKGVHAESDILERNITLTNVVGKFQSGEKLIASDSSETGGLIENEENNDLTIVGAQPHKFEEARSLHMFDKDGDTDQDFAANIVLALVDSTGAMVLDGTDDNAVDEFSKLKDDDGNNNDDNVILETQRVAKLIESEKNISVFKLPKNTIKTLLTKTNNGASDTQFTVRRQFIGTTNSSGVVSFSATGSNETFVGFTDRDYMCTVLTAGGGSAAAGDVIPLTDKVSGTSTGTVSITDSTLLGSAAKVKVNTTILKTGVVSKTKTTNLCKQLKVLASDADGAYGIRATDQDISLGRADAYKLVAIYDSESTSADATVPSMTLTSTTGTFLRGEKVVGASSGAQGRILTTTSPMSYSLQGNAGAINFVAGEVITGSSSKATATVGVITAGSKVITSSFTFDSGQRDNYYDISRITRKKGAPVPLGRLLVVYDFLSHGSGDVFTVDSYSPLNGQMEFDNIPIYTGTKVDPDAPEPTGTFPLRDCFDFRPTVQNIAGTSTSITTVDQITGNSFNIDARKFTGTGGVIVDSPKPATNIQADFEFFVGYMAAVFLARNGRFMLQYGVAAEIPKPPKDVNDTLKLATITVPPFTFSPLDVKVQRYKTQRFTMRDIGRLKDRVERLEDLTSLSLLEASAESFEIQDQNGLNRFKSGFLVDNFKGHRVGAALNPDYKIAVDIINGELRPKCVMRSVGLIERNTTDEARNVAGYRRSGDLITLPYSVQSFIDQGFATRLEYVQPYATPSWVGHITLIPSGDDWFETEVAPTINNSVMGDYDTVLANNQNSLGTFWNAHEIVSVGVTTDSSQAWQTSYQSDGYTESLVQTSIDTTTTIGKDIGVTNTIVEDIVFTNNTSISTQLIPYVRSRKIKFIGECFMPGKQIFPFFDGVDVSAFTAPLNADYMSSGTTFDGTDNDQGKNLITNQAGKIEGFFTIPEHSFEGQENVPKFETQKELEFRLTSSPVNAKVGFNGVLIGSSTAGSTTYSAIGVLETTQDTITSTKNGKIVSTDVNQTTSVTTTGAAYTSTLESNYTQTVFPEPVYVPVEQVQDNSPGFSCPSPDTIINLTEDNTKQAGDLEVGDIIYTQHEDTLEWGNYPITHVEIISNSERLMMKFDHTDFVCSPTHKFYTEEGGWTEVQDMKVNDIVSGHTLMSITEHSVGDVVKITVDDAHTYISAGMLSHNKSLVQQPPDDPVVVTTNNNNISTDNTVVVINQCIPAIGQDITSADHTNMLLSSIDQLAEITVADDYISYYEEAAFGMSQEDFYNQQDTDNANSSSNSNDDEDEGSGGFGYQPTFTASTANLAAVDNLVSQGVDYGLAQAAVSINQPDTSQQDDDFMDFDYENDLDAFGGSGATVEVSSSNDDDGGGGDSSGGDGSVLCTLLHKRGYLPTEVWEQDSAFGKWVYDNEPEVLAGYHAWALPMTKWIEKDSLLAKLWFYAWVLPFTKCWAQHIAHKMKPQIHKDNKIGWFMLTLGIPLCRLIGRFQNKNNFSWLQQNTLLNKKDL